MYFENLLYKVEWAGRSKGEVSMRGKRRDIRNTFNSKDK